MLRRFAYVGRCFGLGIMHFIREHVSYSPANNFGLFCKSSACVVQPMWRRFAYMGLLLWSGYHDV